jgi:hypothetical protein
MKYLKRFNESVSDESINAIVDDVRDCFLELNDLCNVKIVRNGNFQEWYKSNIKQLQFNKGIEGGIDGAVTEQIQVTLGFDHTVASLDNMKETDWGVSYRPVINGEEIVEELVDAIIKCEGYTGLKIKRAELKWVNAGEWGQKGKEGLGPGMLGKVFKPDGMVGPIHNPTKGHYSTDILTDFILNKGDRLRYLKIEYEL